MKKFLIESGVPFEGDFIKLPSWCKRIKIDVGLADCAIHSKIWLGKDHNMFKDTVVFGFEPDPESVRKLRDPSIKSSRKIETSCIGNSFFLIPCALGNVSPGDSLPSADLYVTPKCTECKVIHKDSLHRGKDDSDIEDSDDEEKKKNMINGPPKDFIKKISVPIWSLNHFLSYMPFGRGIDYIDYVKIDCCGSELDVLHGASRYLERIAILTVSPTDKYNIEYFLIRDFVKYEENNAKTPKNYNSFAILPTYYNRRLIDAIRSRVITFYQIGLLDS